MIIYHSKGEYPFLGTLLIYILLVLPVTRLKAQILANSECILRISKNEDEL
jgi:hypothetical protein